MTPPDPRHLPETEDGLPPYVPTAPQIARPPSDESRDAKAIVRWLAGAVKVIAAIGALAGAGATGGVTTHYLTEYRLTQVETHLDAHLKQDTMDKAAQAAANAQLERELQDLRLDYGVKLAELRSGVDDIKDGLRRIESKLDDLPATPQREPRYAPRPRHP